MRRTILASICLVFNISSPCAADEDENWGYLWNLRTMRLHALTGTSVTIGRLLESDIVLNEERVSRRHAAIRRSANRVELADRGSTNGTRLNGSPILPGDTSPVAPGDLFQIATEILVYHESKSELWDDVLQLTFLSRVGRLRVPVLQDRKVNSLGRERVVAAVSQASVDPETGEVQMTYPEGDTRRRSTFEPKEAVFICNVRMDGGALHLSLWGLSRNKLVSRRGSLENLTHGELTLGALSESHHEGRSHFESSWTRDGVRFLFPLLDSVVERTPEGQSITVMLELARGLAEQEETTGPRDAADMLALQHRFDPTNEKIVLLAARAEALWVQRKAEKGRGGLSDEERSLLMDALDASREWVRKAIELDAREKEVKTVEAEIVKATTFLEKLP